MSITIRNVPDEVRDALAARAAARGRSLQEHVLSELRRLAEVPAVEDLADRIRARKASTGTTLASRRIIEHRDAGRR